jgi:hypothetical protein
MRGWAKCTLDRCTKIQRAKSLKKDEKQKPHDENEFGNKETKNVCFIFYFAFGVLLTFKRWSYQT